MRLICLPPAGAGPSLFRPWQRIDPQVSAPTIPGREGRYHEPAPGDLRRLVDRLAVENAAALPARYALFGYSMGGTVALLLARRLVAMGLPAPEALFVLGAPPPDRLRDGTTGFHHLNSDAFWSEIRRLGGTPDEIIADPDLRALFEPALRQDFRICDDYLHVDDGFRLACPIHVFAAEDDHLITADDAAHWGAFTRAGAQVHAIRGGHMLDAPSFAALHGRIRALLPYALAG